MTLNVYEQAILRLLKTARRSLTTSQVADKLGISWETAKKYLELLHRNRYVSMQHEGNRIYWKIKP
ncbi:MAG: helix-turn-helix domain-containing protein [Bacteroidales bacterium]|nr:helix-turn-helix domain-containing protein [Bacteroidales bacterium]